MSGVNIHKHVVDGREVWYPNGNCPICTAGSTGGATGFPKWYVKDNSVTVRLSRSKMLSATFYDKDKVFLVTIQNPAKSEDAVFTKRKGRTFGVAKVTQRVPLECFKDFVLRCADLVGRVFRDVSGVERD